MPRLPKMPPATRFFGRVLAFQLECPRCGAVHWIGPRRPTSYHWNRVTCVFECRCGQRLTVGLAVWLGTKSANQARAPIDTRPTKHQLLALRQMAQAFLLQLRRPRGPAEVNLYIAAECLCPVNGWAVACPIHGDHAQHPDAEESLL